MSRRRLPILNQQITCTRIQRKSNISSHTPRPSRYVSTVVRSIPSPVSICCLYLDKGEEVDILHFPSWELFIGRLNLDRSFNHLSHLL
ncbi:hypothetical protein NPIL_701521, partial [Nephila pilipes]